MNIRAPGFLPENQPFAIAIKMWLWQPRQQALEHEIAQGQVQPSHRTSQ
jgi:hypothetical protein